RVFSISELAREFNVSTRTIRFYEEKGFVSPGRRGQQRIYTPADRARIRLLLRGKRIGLSLAESMEIIEMYEPSSTDSKQLDTLLNRIHERRSTLLQQQNDLQVMLEALDEVESLCLGAKEHNQPDKKVYK
ncbi:MAG: MerR family DNA-binding transcriptional regulator, partial [Pseudomonadota bacterium]